MLFFTKGDTSILTKHKFTLSFVFKNRPPRPFKLLTCKFGAGCEETIGQGNTPGYKLTEIPYLEETESGFKKLRMPRNHPRINQCSEDMLQSWRANCDIQIFTHESNPDYPDMDEIARVTDYTVGYACKGTQKSKDEKDQIKAFVKRYM